MSTNHLLIKQYLFVAQLLQALFTYIQALQTDRQAGRQASMHADRQAGSTHTQGTLPRQIRAHTSLVTVCISSAIFRSLTILDSGITVL